MLYIGMNWVEYHKIKCYFVICFSKRKYLFHVQLFGTFLFLWRLYDGYVKIMVLVGSFNECYCQCQCCGKQTCMINIKINLKKKYLLNLFILLNRVKMHFT